MNKVKTKKKPVATVRAKGSIIGALIDPVKKTVKSVQVDGLGSVRKLLNVTEVEGLMLKDGNKILFDGNGLYEDYEDGFIIDGIELVGKGLIVGYNARTGKWIDADFSKPHPEGTFNFGKRVRR